MFDFFFCSVDQSLWFKLYRENLVLQILGKLVGAGPDRYDIKNSR